MPPPPTLEDSIKDKLPKLPGFRGLPTRLLDRLMPGIWEEDTERVYSDGELILCLYAGKGDETSTKSAFYLEAPRLSEFFLEFDTDRKLPYQDVLDDRNFQELILVAASGKLVGVLGRPNCRTWSILRHFLADGYPGVVRDRAGDGVWGEAGLTQVEQLDVVNDSLLLLRMLLLFHVACQFGGQLAIFHSGTQCGPCWVQLLPQV